MFISALAFSFAAAVIQPTLQDIHTEVAKDGFSTELVFDQPLNNPNISVDYINETVQINIPDVGFEQGKRGIRVKDQRVRSVYTYQSEANLLRSRIIYKKGTSALEFQGKVTVTNDGAKLRVHVEDRSPQPIKKTLAQLEAELLPPKSLGGKVEKASGMKKKVEVAALAPSLVLSDNELSGAAKKMNNSSVAKTKKKQIAGTAKIKKIEAELDESKIPVLGNKPGKTKKSSVALLGRLGLSLLLVLGLFAGVAVVGRKWVKAKAPNNTGQKIRVLTQHHLGPKKSLAIVRVAGESILIGVTDQNISMIKSLSLMDEDVPETSPTNFASTLGAHEEDEGEEVDFAIKGIKDIVKDRLQGMRNI